MNEQFPEFSTLDEVIEYARSIGATHVSLSNYHGGAFVKMFHPELSRSYGLLLHFNTRAPVDNPLAYARNNGWVCYSAWTEYGETYPTKDMFLVYPLFSLGCKDQRALDYLENMRICNDVDRVFSSDVLLRRIEEVS